MRKRLSELKIGASGIIDTIDNEELVTLMYEMGMLPNTPITLETIAPLGDPIVINNGNYSLSIRKSEAQHIWVNIK